MASGRRPVAQIIEDADLWIASLSKGENRPTNGHSSHLMRMLADVLHDPYKVAMAPSSDWSIVVRLLEKRGLDSDVEKLSSLVLELRRCLTPAQCAEASKVRNVAEEMLDKERGHLREAIESDSLSQVASIVASLQRKLKKVQRDQAKWEALDDKDAIDQCQMQASHLSVALRELQNALERIEHRHKSLNGEFHGTYGPGGNAHMDAISATPLAGQIGTAITELTHLNNPTQQLTRTGTFAVREVMELRDVSEIIELSGGHECYTVDSKHSTTKPQESMRQKWFREGHSIKGEQERTGEKECNATKGVLVASERADTPTELNATKVRRKSRASRSGSMIVSGKRHSVSQNRTVPLPPKRRRPSRHGGPETISHHLLEDSEEVKYAFASVSSKRVSTAPRINRNSLSPIKQRASLCQTRHGTRGWKHKDHPASKMSQTLQLGFNQFDFAPPPILSPVLNDKQMAIKRRNSLFTLRAVATPPSDLDKLQRMKEGSKGAQHKDVILHGCVGGYAQGKTTSEISTSVFRTTLKSSSSRAHTPLQSPFPSRYAAICFSG